MTIAVVHLGCPGHLCIVRDCQWRRHSQIGDVYRVSTVGDYFPRDSKEREHIGADAGMFFETMVFSTFHAQENGNEGCGCRELRSLDGVYTARYATAGEAQTGHDVAVARFVELAERQA